MLYSHNIWHEESLQFGDIEQNTKNPNEIAKVEIGGTPTYNSVGFCAEIQKNDLTHIKQHGSVLRPLL